MLTIYKLGIPHLCRMIMLCVTFLVLGEGVGLAQDFQFDHDQERQSLSFKSAKNLIIIPVYINDKGPFDFILDTGVGPMIITDPTIFDHLNFNTMRKIQVSGLGVETVDAYVSQTIYARVGNATIQNIPTAILKEDFFNLSGHLGMKIYGLIGYNFFNSFVVDIRYSENRIIFRDPLSKIKYKGSKIPIQIENMKPYVQASVESEDGLKMSARLLMDTGASHALSMETYHKQMFPIPQKTIPAALGMSLSGQIVGVMGRIKSLSVGKYTFKDVLSGFPDYARIAEKIDLSERNGTLGAEFFKKFDVQLNYREGFMFLKPNSNFKSPFEYDMAGMVVYLDGENFNRFFIGEIDEKSPAERSGLCPDDQIIGINFKSADQFSLSELTNLFKGGDGKSVILEIYRDNKAFFKVIHLERRI